MSPPESVWLDPTVHLSDWHFSTCLQHMQSMCVVCIGCMMCRTPGTREGKASVKERDKLSESQRGSVTTDGLLDNKNGRPRAPVGRGVCVATAQDRAMCRSTCCMPFTFHGLYSLLQIHGAPLTVTHTHTCTHTLLDKHMYGTVSVYIYLYVEIPILRNTLIHNVNCTLTQTDIHE